LTTAPVAIAVRPRIIIGMGGGGRWWSCSLLLVLLGGCSTKELDRAADRVLAAL